MHVLTRTALVLALVGAGALGWMILSKHEQIARVSAAKPDASEVITPELPKLKHRLPAIPDLKSIHIDQVPEVRLSEPVRPGATEVENSLRTRDIKGFREFIANNNVTPLQERLLLALMADIEDDIKQAKLVQSELEHSKIRIPRATYDKLGPEKTMELVDQEREKRMKDAQELSDASREALQADYDERAKALLSEDQFSSWHCCYDLSDVTTLLWEGPFTESGN